MSETLHRVQALVLSSDYLISRHGFRELAADDIVAQDALAGVATAVVVEDYPDSRKEPSVLVLQYDRDSRPIHVVWGVPRVSTRHLISLRSAAASERYQHLQRTLS
jgi:uncharacterized DUF497 family protein